MLLSVVGVAITTPLARLAVSSFSNREGVASLPRSKTKVYTRFSIIELNVERITCGVRNRCVTGLASE